MDIISKLIIFVTDEDNLIMDVRFYAPESQMFVWNMFEMIVGGVLGEMFMRLNLITENVFKLSRRRSSKHLQKLLGKVFSIKVHLLFSTNSLIKSLCYKLDVPGINYCPNLSLYCSKESSLRY